MNPVPIVKPSMLKTWQQDAIYCQYDSNLVTEFTPEMFSSTYWQSKNMIAGTAQGRGTTWFINNKEQHWVLRHYYRGGLIGKLINDSYIYFSLTKTRAIKEFNLLSVLQTYELPAPKPVACHVQRAGITYSANIVTERIMHAQDLVGLLQQNNVTEDQWRKIGQCIKQFHQQGIYHHDLNCHNILIDTEGKVWLIDFDQGEQRSVQTTWQQQNLARLHRSFVKENNRLENFYWQEQNWLTLLEGYSSS